MSLKTHDHPNPAQNATPVSVPQSQPPPSPVARERASQPEPDKPRPRRPLRIYSHSSYFYWWPVWAVGFLMAILTYWHGKPQQIEAIGQAREWIHPSSNLGVAFFLVLFLVILITNFSVRGLASGMVILAGVLLAVVLAYVRWWDNIFSWFGDLTVHLTMGAYFWFSTLMFLTWVVTVFGLDRLNYWEVTPGQLTHKSRFGTSSKSYNSQGMGMEKHRDDLFRYWLLGLGSGDLKILTSGATREQIEVPNVLFIGSKVAAMQRLIAEIPDGQQSS